MSRCVTHLPGALLPHVEADGGVVLLRHAPGEREPRDRHRLGQQQVRGGQRERPPPERQRGGAGGQHPQ
eukprot:498637-Prorocentrum_minimum.AAC.1